MNSRKLLILFLVMISVSLIANAQTVKDDLQERQRIEDMERQQEELNKNYYRMAAPEHQYLEYFLPDSKNSWFISITRSGGILGGSKLLAAVNSEGRYLCSEEQDFSNQFIEKNIFSSLSSTINSVEMTKLNLFEVKSLSGCMDCAITKFTYRSGNTTKTYFGVDSLSDNSKLKEIYNQVVNSASCK